MMEENKKGANTLYAVIGVATLVVAIIGATFAYFSASQTNSDIQGTTAEAGGLTIEAKLITENTNNDIIPLNLIVDQTKKEGSETEYVDHTDQFEQAMANKCKDSLGNNICAVYRVVVANQSKTSTIQVRGKLNLTSSTKNMYWTLIDATVDETTTGEDPETQVISYTMTGATAKADFVKVKQGLDGNITYKAAVSEDTQLNEPDSVSLYGTDNDTVSTPSKATYYILVWLEETGAEQQGDDASAPELKKNYTGNITFDAVDAQGNKSGVTATFLS